MNNAKKKRAQKAEQAKTKKEKQDDALDRALMDSFPSSDPISLTEPAPKDDAKRNQPPPKRQEAPGNPSRP
ncbi:MAG: hypothetical protein IPJ65_00655 [Archangiaceae bacterium]|nr:hypothetical protein [Archangiaceae bacterium]